MFLLGLEKLKRYIVEIFDFPNSRGSIADFHKIPENEQVVLTVWVFHFSDFGRYLEGRASNLKCSGA